MVRLTCPICQRNNFSSAQGFLNHSRIAHSKEFTSQDAAALKCGDIIPEIKQDATGEASIKQLTEKGLDPSKNLNVAEYLFGPVTGNGNSTSTGVATTGNSTPKPEGSPRFDTDDQDQQLQQESPAPSPVEQLNELMKKLINEGKMKKEEYEKLLNETKQPIENAHLFEDEVEIDESEESSLSTNPSFSNLVNLNDKRRRVSRGGINISVSKDTPDEDLEEEEPVEKKQKRK